MAIGEIIELSIEKITNEGAGIGRHEGKAVFVDFTAPGDTALVRVFEERRGFSRASLEKLIEPSPFRVEPSCPHFGECGGCALQHIGYQAQLEQKKLLLADAFSRIGSFAELPAMKVFASAPYGYRSRMQFHRAGRNAGIGLKKRAGKETLPIAECPVADEGIRMALAASTLRTPQWLDRFNVFSYGGTFLSEGGVERGSVSVAGKALKLDVNGFFQSNVPMLEQLLDEILSAARAAVPARGDGSALDLYCGVGTFAAFLADLFPRIDLVELDRKAAALAQENAKGTETRLFALSDDDWAKRRAGKNVEAYDFAVVDPPRVGLSAALKASLAERPPRVLAYVSCDPATLARDAKELGSSYELSSLSLYDFYPQTPHIESLAIFRSRA